MKMEMVGSGVWLQEAYVPWMASCGKKQVQSGKGIVSVITYSLTRHWIDVRMKWYGVEADFRRLNVVMLAVANLQMEKPILP